MQNYASNSKSNRPEKNEPPPKEVKQVVSEPVTVKKKGVGSKFKEIFAGDDAKSVVSYVFADVLIPAARDMIMDAITKGTGRMMYGDRAPSPRPGGYGMQGTTSRISYNRPADPRMRQRPLGPRYQPRAPMESGDDYILSSKAEAEIVLEAMTTVIEQYGIVTMEDLKTLLGQRATHIDVNWGWDRLGGAEIRQAHGGFILELPPAQALN